MTPIDGAVNVGPVLAGELRAAGVETLEDLRELGYRRPRAWMPYSPGSVPSSERRPTKPAHGVS